MTAKDGTVRGGQRDGAGDKPGSRFDAARAAIARQARLDHDAAKRISPPDYILIALRHKLSGYGPDAIAKKVGRPKATIVTWLNRYQSWLADERERQRTDAAAAHDHLREPALKVLAEALESGTGTVKLKAYEDVADRIWGSTVPAGSTPGNTSFSITYIDGSTNYVMPTPSQPITIEHEPSTTDDPGES